MCATLAGGCGNSGEAHLAGEFHDPSQILLPIFPVAPGDVRVLVLYLQENDGTAVRCQARQNNLGQTMEILLNTRRVRPVHCANCDARFIAQVRRITAVIPLGTDVRANAEKHRKLVLLAEIEEVTQVSLT